MNTRHTSPSGSTWHGLGRWCTTLGAVAGLCAATPALAGSWTPARILQGSIAVSSLPESPRVAMNGQGHALLAWNASGAVRYAERVKGGSWVAAATAPGGTAGAGPVAATIGGSEAAAIAYVTAATRYTPSRLMVTWRAAGAAFGAAVEPVPGAVAGDVRLGLDCSGRITLVWSNATGVYAASLAGTGAVATQGAGADVAAVPCNGQPGAGSWAAAELLSAGETGASLAELAVNDAGAALVAWQVAVAGSPVKVTAAYRPADGTWEPPQTVSAANGQATWNPKSALDATGQAAIGYLDGTSMVVVRRPAGGAWGTPELVSGTKSVYYPALAMSGAGDLVVAYLALDASNIGSVWSSTSVAGAPWSAAVRLSARSESTDWPSAAYAADGSVAVVGWTDNNTNIAKVSVGVAGTWVRSNLGGGYWAGTVPVAAGGGAAVGGWTSPTSGNPNSARLMGRVWE